MSRQPVKQSGDGQTILKAGFAAILVLMTSLTLLGLKKMDEINAQLELIVQQHNVKSALVKQMRISARERVFTMQQMLMTDDIFEQDEAALSIDELGAQFTAARQRFVEMPLEPYERAMLDIQRNWTQQSVPLQREAVNLIISGKVKEAQRLLREQVIPTQQKVLAMLAQLEARQQGAIEEIFRQTAETHAQARMQIVMLGGIVVALSILIALFTIHRSRAYAEQLFCEKQRAQITLHAIGDGVITTDPQGSIEYMNPVAERLTGWRESAAQGKALCDIFRIFGEQDAHTLYTETARLLQQSLSGEIRHHGTLHDIHHATRKIEFSSSALRDRDGQPLGFVITFHHTADSATDGNTVG